ncbi:hypothetical protein B4916_06010 [Yersinia intermedia]|nr:hypothetical protein B4916_06010 [Yersinia intermedia]
MGGILCYPVSYAGESGYSCLAGGVYPRRRLTYTRHTSSCICVGCLRSPQSLTYVSSWGFT